MGALRRRAIGAFLVTFTTSGAALASSGIDSPENGAEQVGRGSAWVARADDPLAAYYNPATLVTQANGVHLGAHLLFFHECFTRVGADGAPVSPGAGLPGPGAPNGPAAETCNSGKPFPNPQLAATFRLNDRFALGIAVLGPHGAGSYDWPESVTYKNQFGASTSQPAPQRYLVASGSAVLVYPTISVSYAITDTISVGAGFIWGIASIDFTTFAETVSPKPLTGAPTDDFANHQDVKARISAKDFFVPGFVVGGLWQATRQLDVAGWYKWQDAVRSSTDLYVQSHYWKDTGQKNTDPNTGPDAPANTTDVKDAGTFKLRIPMEARIGARFHHPREGATASPRWAEGKRVRDPLSQDLFDAEVDFTWANDSAVDVIEVRMRGDPSIGGQPIAIAGTPGTAPTNADLRHDWRDVVGVRLGGDVVVVPNLVSARAGAFFETKGQDASTLNLDFDLAQRFGLSLGGTVRLGPVDVSAAYQHTFYGTLDNGGRGGIRGMSGDATSNFRTLQAVNGGKLTASLNEVALAGTLRF